MIKISTNFDHFSEIYRKFEIWIYLYFEFWGKELFDLNFFLLVGTLKYFFGFYKSKEKLSKMMNIFYKSENIIIIPDSTQNRFSDSIIYLCI